MPITIIPSYSFANANSRNHSRASSLYPTAALAREIPATVDLNGFKREIDYFRKMSPVEEILAVVLDGVRANNKLTPEQRITQTRKILDLSAQVRIAHDGVDAFERQDKGMVKETDKLNLGERRTLAAISNVRRISSGQATPWFDNKIGELVEQVDNPRFFQNVQPAVQKKQITDLLRAQERQGRRFWSDKEWVWRQTSLEKIASFQPEHVLQSSTLPSKQGEALSEQGLDAVALQVKNGKMASSARKAALRSDKRSNNTNKVFTLIENKARELKIPARLLTPTVVISLNRNPNLGKVVKAIFEQIPRIQDAQHLINILFP